MNAKTIITFVAVCLGVLLGVGGMLWQFGQNSTVKPIVNIEGEARYVKGEGGVTIVVFSDFQCSACAAVQDPKQVKMIGPNLKSLPELLDEYKDKIRFVYRQFPLPSIHKNAMMAAYAAEAAYQQNKFWEMHDKLFATQNQWASLDNPTSKFAGYVKELGMNEEQFMGDMESEATKEVVAKDVLVANQNRLAGTPTFFVDGVEVDFEQLEERLKSKLQ